MGNEKRCTLYNFLIAHRKTAPTLKHQIFVTKNASSFYQCMYCVRVFIPRCGGWWLIKLGALNVYRWNWLLSYYFIITYFFGVNTLVLAYACHPSWINDSLTKKKHISLDCWCVFTIYTLEMCTLYATCMCVFYALDRTKFKKKN